jgi:proteasome lid subunit RPN8/RPN11
MTEIRDHCVVPECRRSFKRGADLDDHGHDEVMCGRCWRTVEPALIRRHRLVHRRMRKATRLLRVKAINSKPGFGVQLSELDRLFRSACERSWASIKADAEMKSRLRMDGTAGALAARRAA